MTQIDTLLIVIEVLSAGWFLLSIVYIFFSGFLGDRGASIHSIVTAVITIGIYILAVGVDSNIENSPTAMDVYQGRTILKYEVVDGEKTDSCVIWKN